MPQLLPATFLFRYSFPIPYIAELPRGGKTLLGLPTECRLPDVTTLNGTPAPVETRLAWNAEGLGIAVSVRGRKQPPKGAAGNALFAEGLQVWIDTRNTQSVHRASRFCHHFCLLPVGGGAKGDEPVGVQLAIPRAREEAPLADSAELQVSSTIRRDGYDLEAWLPARCLHGYDPESSSKVGFYYRLRDAELHDPSLSVGHEFPFATDPSLWSTLELRR